jgi:arsenite methyltransferase
VTVDGVDFATTVVQRARETAERAGLASVNRFHCGDAEQLPFADNTFDAVMTECAFCTFPDKTTAAAELARILRPGGRLGLADVTIAETGLPDELTTLSAWVACIADARPLSHYFRILSGAGLPPVHTEPHDDALVRMIDQVEARLHLARMARTPELVAAGINGDTALEFIDIARRAVTDKLLGYALIVAEKP